MITAPNKVTIRVEVHESALMHITDNFSRHAGVYEELERTLLVFPQAHLVWLLSVCPIGKNSFWIQELAKRFPALFKSGSLAVVPRTGNPSASQCQR